LQFVEVPVEPRERFSGFEPEVDQSRFGLDCGDSNGLGRR
jgi:hypothetical protein